jgi:hypothetical protein
MAKERNVIVFGEAGSGKGSVINMIGEGDDAHVGDNAYSQPARSKPYKRSIRGCVFSVYDTTGLDSTLPPKCSAINPLRDLCALVRRRPLTLLVYVFKPSVDLRLARPRFNEVVGSLPPGASVVMIVTGQENKEPNMDRWWRENESVLKEYGMMFSGHACITANKEHSNKFLKEYKISKEKVEDLIYQFRDAGTFTMQENEARNFFPKVLGIFGRRPKA